jgi:4-hydroxy-tetrahydrodipicolinate reductase
MWRWSSGTTEAVSNKSRNGSGRVNKLLIVYAGNYSTGVNLSLKFGMAAKAFGNDADVRSR